VGAAQHSTAQRRNTKAQLDLLNIQAQLKGTGEALLSLKAGTEGTESKGRTCCHLHSTRPGSSVVLSGAVSGQMTGMLLLSGNRLPGWPMCSRLFTSRACDLLGTCGNRHARDISQHAVRFDMQQTGCST
jgi:hypothetical protein